MLDSVASRMSVRVASSFRTVGIDEASLMFSTAMATRFFGLAPAAVVDARTAGSGGGGICGSSIVAVVRRGDGGCRRRGRARGRVVRYREHRLLVAICGG